MRMERILWGVIFLSGWLVLSTCLREFHVDSQIRTWFGARSYCREKYTDLATVESTEEMNQLINTLSSSDHGFEVWIGLYSRILWKWSDGYRGGGADYRKWKSSDSEPNFAGAAELCVSIGTDGMWKDDDCNNGYPFICHNGTQLNPEFVVINEKLTWSSAQDYCREHFIDLATVTDNAENEQIKSLVPSGNRTWIGLFRDPLFNWSDGSSYSFSFWDSFPNPLGSMPEICGFVAMQRLGRWRLMSCDLRLPFVCYSNPAKKQVVKLKMKLGDRSVDLNDPAVKAGILKKLQDKMQKEAGSGVTLKWRQQPDGKVFHKEGKSSQKKQGRKTEL